MSMRNAEAILEATVEKIGDVELLYSISKTDRTFKELVRCKDCRNAVVYDGNEVVCAHIDSNGNDKHTADWFCADGERKVSEA